MSATPDSSFDFDLPSLPSLPSSLMTMVRVGTFASLKFYTLSESNGTQMLPVFGWIQNGDLRRWFMPVDTLASSLG